MDRKQYIPVVYRAGITTGTTVTSSSASANVAIPTDATGNNPKRLYLIASATPGVHIKLCTSSGTSATAGDLLINATPLVLDAVGAEFVAYIQEGAAAKLNIAPVEQ